MRCGGTARLMVVDDEAEVRGMIAECLVRDGYAVDEAGSGAELDAALNGGAPDLILLDVAMPGEDGLSIARRLKADGPTPIIILSALGDTVDRVVGLEIGADDYVAKPFDMRELRARIRAVLRRNAVPLQPPLAANPGAPADARITFGSAMLNLANRTLTDRGGETVSLTPTELELVETFLRNPNRVLTRELLGAMPGGGTSSSSARAVDIRVTRIRRKIESDPRHPRAIRTVRGVGYIYVPTATG